MKKYDIDEPEGERKLRAVMTAVPGIGIVVLLIIAVALFFI